MATGKLRRRAGRLKQAVLITAIILVAWQLARHGNYSHHYYGPHVTVPRRIRHH